MNQRELIESFWDKAIDFTSYLEIAEQRASQPDAEDAHKEYYELGLQRMKRSLKTYHTEPEWNSQLAEKNFDGKVLIISEPWCGDASATVPAVVKFFEENDVPVSIFLRDEDTRLIEAFLTDGAQAIPKILLLNSDSSLRAVWGPRPAYGKELLAKFKIDPEAYPREKFYADLQVYYAKNKGKDVILEIIEAL